MRRQPDHVLESQRELALEVSFPAAFCLCRSHRFGIGSAGYLERVEFPAQVDGKTAAAIGLAAYRAITQIERARVAGLQSELYGAAMAGTFQ